MEEEKPVGSVTAGEKPAPIKEGEKSDSGVTAEKTDGNVTAEQETQPEQSVQERPARNYEAEWHRKYDGLVQNIPNMVEEVLAKKQQQPQEKEYSISELEAFAQENPTYRPWVEEQKYKLMEKRLEKSAETQRQAEVKRIQEDQARKQAEYQVLNDSRYAEAFVTDASGNRSINPSSQLAQLMGNYMEQMKRDGITRPDAILIAAKLARADMLDSKTPQTEQKLETIKKQVQQLKSKTMVEGGGTPTQQTQKDSFTTARERLAKTGNIKDARVAVAEYLKRTRKVE